MEGHDSLNYVQMTQEIYWLGVLLNQESGENFRQIARV